MNSKTETKQEENTTAIFNEILWVIHCHTAFLISRYDTFIRIFLNVTERRLLCQVVNLVFFFVVVGSLIYSLMRFHKCFSTHNTKRQCDMASTVYKQKSQREERYRDRAEPWPLTFNCWGTPRQMKLPTDTDLEWLLQFSPVTGELTRRRGDSDYQLISRMTDLALLIWVLSVSLLFYFSGFFF